MFSPPPPPVEQDIPPAVLPCGTGYPSSSAVSPSPTAAVLFSLPAASPPPTVRASSGSLFAGRFAGDTIGGGGGGPENAQRTTIYIYIYMYVCVCAYAHTYVRMHAAHVHIRSRTSQTRSHASQS